MLNYKEDIEKTKKVLWCQSVDGYDKIYFSSNECLKDIFYNTDFTNKKVLTVLGSGDQAFHFYSHNATDVDLFDKNKLALYYYYLRIWIIEIYDMYTLPYHVTDNFIIELLNKVRPKNEEEENAYNYWKTFFERFCFNINRDMFFRLQEESPHRRNDIDNLDKIKEQIKLRNINFHYIDISDKNLTLNKKYDVIYTSNISDWLFFNEELYRNFADNLYKLLEDDGTIICADLDRDLGPCELESSIMGERFEYEKLPNLSKNHGRYLAPAYCYKKKK